MLCCLNSSFLTISTTSDIKDLTTSAVIDCVDNESSGELIVRPKPLSTVDQNLTSILSSQSAQKATRNRYVDILHMSTMSRVFICLGIWLS